MTFRETITRVCCWFWKAIDRAIAAMPQYYQVWGCVAWLTSRLLWRDRNKSRCLICLKSKKNIWNMICMNEIEIMARNHHLSAITYQPGEKKVHLTHRCWKQAVQARFLSSAAKQVFRDLESLVTHYSEAEGYWYTKVIRDVLAYCKQITRI